MSYLLPQNVTSPKDRWEYIGTIYDEGEHESSLVYGRWDGDLCIASRWNGSFNDPHRQKGNPISHFQPTWFILPEYMAQVVMQDLLMRQVLGDRRVNSDVLREAIVALDPNQEGRRHVDGSSTSEELAS